LGAGTPRVTMTEVAREAGVSQTTVSLVLNSVESARLSAATRKHVREAAKRLGYRVTRRRDFVFDGAEGALAFVVDELSTDPWMALGLDGVREKAWERGMVVHTFVTGGDANLEQAILSKIAPPRFVGLIFGAINTRRIEMTKFPRDLPIVLLNCYLPDRRLSSVVPAEILGGYVATQRLVVAGHRRLGYIGGEPRMDASRDRLKGYRRALAEAGIPFDRTLVRDGNWEPSAGFERTRSLMAEDNPPTAIFCANDLMAFGCYQALAEMGRRIPQDVAVVGYDDRDIATFLHPPLTTVLLPHYEMGVEAVTCLFDRLGRPSSRASQIKVEGTLIERGSVDSAGPSAERPANLAQRDTDGHRTRSR
jgi:LacI family transcriptional regulator